MTGIVDAAVERLFMRILTRTKERVVLGFHDRLQRFARVLDARGALSSGALRIGMDLLAHDAVLTFGRRLRKDTLTLFRNAYATPSTHALAWLRATINRQVDALAAALGAQIDDHRSHQGMPVGSVEELRRTVAQLTRDTDIEIGTMELHARLSSRPAASRTLPDCDLFISHVSEDQTDVVQPLAAQLQARGYNVDVESYALGAGDHLLRRIDEGLAHSRYGVVVLSRQFFARPWARWELAGLGAVVEARGRNVILPIWHDVSRADVARHSSMLAAAPGVASSVGAAALADAVARALTMPAGGGATGG